MDHVADPSLAAPFWDGGHVKEEHEHTKSILRQETSSLPKFQMQMI